MSRRTKVIEDYENQTFTYFGKVVFMPKLNADGKIEFDLSKPSRSEVHYPNPYDILEDLKSIDVIIDEDPKKSSKTMEHGPYDKREEITLPINGSLDGVENLIAKKLVLKGNYTFSARVNKNQTRSPWMMKLNEKEMVDVTLERKMGIKVEPHHTEDEMVHRRGRLSKSRRLNGVAYEICFTSEQEYRDRCKDIVTQIEDILTARYRGGTSPEEYKKEQAEKHAESRQRLIEDGIDPDDIFGDKKREEE